MSYSARRIYWASQETTTDWVSTATNTAGSLDLATDGIILCGAPSRGLSLIWTTTDLWTMSYLGGDLIYGVDQVGKHCGIISQKAYVVLDTAAYWMGRGKFFSYDGFVRSLPCEVTDYVFGNFSTTYASTVWALPVPQFNEVTWFYPSSLATAPDRYVTFNYAENHWVFGTLQRSAGMPFTAGAVVSAPVMITSAGVIYDHETGTLRTGQTVFLESGPMEVGDGDQVQRIQKIVPDDKTVGDVSASLYTALSPDDAEVLNGPYTLTSQTSVRVTARQVRLRITEVAQTAWRVGVVRLGAIAGGRR